MTTVDDKAVWWVKQEFGKPIHLILLLLRIMQNWVFVYDPVFWSEDRTKALLTSVPPVTIFTIVPGCLIHVDPLGAYVGLGSSIRAIPIV